LSSAPASEEGLAVRFWGVRGSTPVFGRDYLMFGGSTMCLELFAGNDRVIVDAGSGIQQLGRLLLNKDVRDAHILLTHFHVDHIIGLMTFAPLFRKGFSLTVHAPILESGPPGPLLERFFATPHFPVSPGEAEAHFSVRSFHPGDSFSVCGMTIGTHGLTHPGGACGYRVGHGGRSIAVIVDHEHAPDRPRKALVDFCSSTDLILYDAHWDEAVDYAPHRGWGHSTWQAGLRLLRAAGAGCLGCVHHAPQATDADLLCREESLRQSHFESFFAREGETVRLGPEHVVAGTKRGA
jgi:phosphoribosyl 1,2-cyclic phosphodiesterase